MLFSQYQNSMALKIYFLTVSDQLDLSSSIHLGPSYLLSLVLISQFLSSRNITALMNISSFIFRSFRFLFVSHYFQSIPSTSISPGLLLFPLCPFIERVLSICTSIASLQDSTSLFLLIIRLINISSISKIPQSWIRIAFKSRIKDMTQLKANQTLSPCPFFIFSKSVTVSADVRG